MKKKQAFSLEKGSEPFCRLKACFFLESMTKELRSKKFFFAVSFHILLHSNVREDEWVKKAKRKRPLVLVIMSRSSRSQMFLNIGVLEIFTTFNFIKKIQFYYTNLSKKRFQHRYFPVNIANFLRTPFSQNTSRTPASICLSQTIRKSFISIFYAEKNLSWRDAIYNRYAITLAGA